jgi:hypothetical protein
MAATKPKSGTAGDRSSTGRCGRRARSSLLTSVVIGASQRVSFGTAHEVREIRCSRVSEVCLVKRAKSEVRRARAGSSVLFRRGWDPNPADMNVRLERIPLRPRTANDDGSCDRLLAFIERHIAARAVDSVDGFPIYPRRLIQALKADATRSCSSFLMPTWRATMRH